MNPEEVKVVEKVIETLSVRGAWKHDGIEYLDHKSNLINIICKQYDNMPGGYCFISCTESFSYSIKIESEENPDYYEKISGAFNELEKEAKEERNRIQRRNMMNALNSINNALGG